MKRREFVKASAGAGLLIAFHVPKSARAAASKTVMKPNAYLRIADSGIVTVIVGRSEMGQGVLTSMPMIVAEELDADWRAVRWEQAGADKAFALKGDFGQQVTGGSESVRYSWDPLRRAGAQAREMLVGAAADAWGVKAAECRTEEGAVLGPAGQRATYGELATKAGARSVPSHPALKDPKNFRIVGKPIQRLDLPSKTDGTAVFGIDVKLPGLLVAVIARPPVFKGKVVGVDTKAALAVPGVKRIFPIASGIAVVATDTWSAMKGRDALTLTFDDGDVANVDSKSIRALFEAAAKKRGRKARNDGNAPKVIAASAKKIDSVYETPFLAHATMEPVNCTAWVREGSCEVWGPIQNQTAALKAAHKFSGLPAAACSIHTTLLGGGFGRRLEWDYVEEAVQVSREAKAPVRVLWTRDDDIQHDFYRPATYNRMRAAIDADGMPTAWHHHIVGSSIVGRLLPLAAILIVDPTSVDGAQQVPYSIPNVKVTYVRQETGVPVGPWRSVGSSQNAFAVECFFDEVAAAGGKDPYELRRTLLAKKARHLGVLERAAKEAGWGTSLPAGRARGIAVHESFGTYVAHVAEVSLEDDAVRVHRVVSAIDCGQIVNPDTVVAQVQGAIAFGLSAALKGAITIAKGRVEQSNFHDYRLVRMKEMPKVEVHLIASTEKHGGVGEPGVPPVAPAICNALFALTGKRVRSLPIDVTALAK